MLSPENIYLERKYIVNSENIHALHSLNNITFGWLNQFNVRQHDNGLIMDDQSQFNTHADGWTQVHSTQSSLVVTHSSTN